MPGRILAIRPRALGDVVLTTPALRALRRGHPDAELEVVTESRYAPLLEGLPGIDRVWRLERGAADGLGLIARLRARRYDLAVDFFGGPRSALITALSGARTRAGYDLRGRRYAYRLRVPRAVPLPAGRREYAAASHVRLAAAVGGVEDGLEARVAVSARGREEAGLLFARAGVSAPGRTVGLVAPGSWPTKAWPLSHSAMLALRLVAAGLPVLALSGPGEERATAALRRLVPGIAVLPECDVGTLAAVVERLAAVVGTDSGPRHLAAALGVATFAWFGPTHPDNWSPAGARHGWWWTDLPCRACGRTACPHWNCMPGLSPERAAELVLRHLERHAGIATALGAAARA